MRPKPPAREGLRSLQEASATGRSLGRAWLWVGNSEAHESRAEQQYQVDEDEHDPEAAAQPTRDGLDTSSNASVLTRAHERLFHTAIHDVRKPLQRPLALRSVMGAEEQKLSQELGVADTVQKGLLPLPLSLQIEREYQVLQEETHGFRVTVPTAGVDVEIKLD